MQEQIVAHIPLCLRLGGKPPTRRFPRYLVLGGLVTWFGRRDLGVSPKAPRSSQKEVVGEAGHAAPPDASRLAQASRTGSPVATAPSRCGTGRISFRCSGGMFARKRRADTPRGTMVTTMYRWRRRNARRRSVTRVVFGHTPRSSASSQHCYSEHGGAGPSGVVSSFDERSLIAL
jgi:hypothetical protein